MRNLQKGFTLLELIVVLLIIGILSAIAVNRYQDYIAKTQVSEAIQLADSAKIDMLQAIDENARCFPSKPTGSNADFFKLGKYSLLTAGSGNNDDATSWDLTPDTKDDNNANQYTGCYVTIKYGLGSAGNKISPKIKGKNLTLALLYNGQWLAASGGNIPDQGKSAIDKKLIPSSIKFDSNDNEEYLWGNGEKLTPFGGEKENKPDDGQ